MTTKNKVPETKLKIVRELSDLIKNKKTLLVASIKNIPASQFQEIVKKLRGKAIVKVLKKNLITRALDSSENQQIKKLKEQIQSSVAILFSDLDSFELASELLESKSPAKARMGQEAPEDIEIEAGPTDLMPGPAISELGSLGIQVQIEKGKINIKEPKVIVKKGEKISANAASVMNKLDMKPFKLGFIPLSAFDTPEGKLYLEIKIDKEATLEELKTAWSKGLAFAIEIKYITKDTIKFMIRKAGLHKKVLENLVGKEKIEEKREEEKKAEQEKPDDEKKEKKEDSKEDKKEVDKEDKGGEVSQSIKESGELKAKEEEKEEVKRDDKQVSDNTENQSGAKDETKLVEQDASKDSGDKTLANNQTQQNKNQEEK